MNETDWEKLPDSRIKELAKVRISVKDTFDLALKCIEELASKVAVTSFKTDATSQVETGNKAAGTRARKASLEVEKMMKEFRKVSLAESAKK